MKLLFVDSEENEERIRSIFSRMEYEPNNLVFVHSVKSAEEFISNYLVRDQGHIDAIITNNVDDNPLLENAHHLIRFLNIITESYSRGNFRVNSIPVILYSNADDKSDLRSIGFSAIVKSNDEFDHPYLVRVVEDQIKKWRISLQEDLDILELEPWFPSFSLDDAQRQKYQYRFGRNALDTYSKTKVLSLEFIKSPAFLQYDWISVAHKQLEDTMSRFATMYRYHVRYDRRNNERTIIHKFFLENPSMLYRDSYTRSHYEKRLWEQNHTNSQICDFILVPELPLHQNTTFFEIKKEDVKMMVKANKKRPMFSQEMHAHLYQISDYQKYVESNRNQEELCRAMGYSSTKHSYQLLVGRLEEKLELQEHFDQLSQSHFPGIEVTTYDEFEALYAGYIEKTARLRIN